MAQEQINKIKNLLQQARGRHDILDPYSGELDVSKLARIDTEDPTYAKGFDLRKSHDVSFARAKQEKVLKKKNIKSNSIAELSYAIQTYDTQRSAKDQNYPLQFGNNLPSVRSTHRGQTMDVQVSNRYTSRAEKPRQYSVSGMPQRGTERSSMMGKTA